MDDRLLVTTARNTAYRIPSGVVRYESIRPLVNEPLQLKPRIKTNGVEIAIFYEISSQHSMVIRQPEEVFFMEGDSLIFDDILIWEDLTEVFQGYTVAFIETLQPEVFSPSLTLQGLLTERIEEIVVMFVDGDDLGIDFSLRFSFGCELRKRVLFSTWHNAFKLSK